MGGLMVAFGAFGACLKRTLIGESLSWYQTGIRYGMWHVLAGLIYDISTPYQRGLGFLLLLSRYCYFYRIFNGISSNGL